MMGSPNDAPLPNNNSSLPSNALMRFEQSRLETFRSWPPNARVEAGKIARAGFFRLDSNNEDVNEVHHERHDSVGSIGSTTSSIEGGSPTQVMCSWCGVVISQWDYGDQVMSRHRSANPNCPFIKNESNNVPLGGTGSASEVGVPSSEPQEEEMEEGEITRDLEEGEITDESANNTANEEAEQEIDYPDDAGRHLRRDVLSVTQTDHGSDSGMEVDHGQPSSNDVGPSSSSGASSSSSGATNNSLLDHPSLHSERARLRTYAKWPLDFIHPRDLARTGFVYTGRADCVRCVFCGEYVGEWERTDVPATEHRNLFGHCPFIQGQDVGNVTLEEEQDREVTLQDVDQDTETETEDETGGGSDEAGIRQRDLNTRTERGVQQTPVLQWNSSSSRDTPRRSHDAGSVQLEAPSSSPQGRLEGSGIVAHSGPAHPKHSTVESRLRTFRDWPPALRQTPKELADAGFYYIGLSDQVKCFYCDGGLRNWQSEDEPWTEHARWFSKCAFIRLVKGDDFIQECLKKHDDSPEENAATASASGEPTVKPSLCDEAAVNAAMNGLLAQQALSMGLDASRVKVALRRRLRENGGQNFTTVNQLVESAFSMHSEQEDRHRTENGDFDRRGQDATVSRLRDISLSTPTKKSEEETGAKKSQIPQPGASTSSSAAIVAPAVLKHSTSEPSATVASAALSLPPLVKSQTTTEHLGEELERENRQLKEQRLCKICMDGDIGVVFLPCGHLICCVQCAPALKDCPLCRKPIHGTVKTYMS